MKYDDSQLPPTPLIFFVHHYVPHPNGRSPNLFFWFR